MMNWNALAKVIEEHERFLVISHVRPDGDAIGSCLGMAEILRFFGKDVRIMNVSPVPARYEFLDPNHQVERFGETATPENLVDRQVIVILDLSSWSQLGRAGDWVRQFPGKRVIIDHHVSEDDMNALVFKDTKAEAAGTLVLDAARALGVPLNTRMAEALLAAISMDTGWFAHSNTKSQTLRDAAELIDAGVDLSAVHRNLFKRSSLSRLRLLGQTLSRMQTEMDGKIAYACVAQEDIKRMGAHPSETEDLVDYTVSLDGVVIGILFVELLSGGIKASFRSRFVDVAAIAKRFGGGGHIMAAGASLDTTLTEARDQVLELVRQAVANIK